MKKAITKKPKKSLQKLTKPTKKINELMKSENVTWDNLKSLNEAEQRYFLDKLMDESNALDGNKRQAYMNRFTEIFSEETQNKLWENNHLLISSVISNLIGEYNRMPSCAEIAVRTELSRQTVHKHLKHYSGHTMFLEQAEQFKILVPCLLAKVYKFACKGDISAAKLYFKMLGHLNNEPATNKTLVQNQNNYIQINGMVLSQENLKHLKPDQLNTIESILKTALPKSQILELELPK